MNLKRKRRVRMHLLEDGLPSVEGLLVARRRREYVIALPSLLLHPGREAEQLADARVLEIPRERVAFFEMLR